LSTTARNFFWASANWPSKVLPNSAEAAVEMSYGQQGLGVVRGFGQGGLGGGQVQFDQLLDAFESLGGQAEQGVEGGLLGGDELFRGQHGVHSGCVGVEVARLPSALNPGNSFPTSMLQCSMGRSIGSVAGIASGFCCAATF
jgi:hypothetical protein